MHRKVPVGDNEWHGTRELDSHRMNYMEVRPTHTAKDVGVTLPNMHDIVWYTKLNTYHTTVLSGCRLYPIPEAMVELSDRKHTK